MFHRPLVVVEPGTSAHTALAAARAVAAPCAVYDIVCLHPAARPWVVGTGCAWMPVCEPIDWDAECDTTLRALAGGLPQDVCVRTSVLAGAVRARLCEHVRAGAHDVIVLGTSRPLLPTPALLADRLRRRLSRLTPAPVLAPLLA